jgi:osmotically-inducible protein OsmY
MKMFLIPLALAITVMLAACSKDNDERRSANTPSGADKMQSSADRPANPGPTASDQLENEADRNLTQQIRQRVVEDGSLSTSAHNVTIVSQNGNVTLRGNVKDESEKEKIAATAKQVAGVNKVDNQLTVAGG